MKSLFHRLSRLFVHLTSQEDETMDPVCRDSYWDLLQELVEQGQAFRHIKNGKNIWKQAKQLALYLKQQGDRSPQLEAIQALTAYRLGDMSDAMEHIEAVRNGECGEEGSDVCGLVSILQGLVLLAQDKDDEALALFREVAETDRPDKVNFREFYGPLTLVLRMEAMDAAGETLARKAHDAMGAGPRCREAADEAAMKALVFWDDLCACHMLAGIQSGVGYAFARQEALSAKMGWPTRGFYKPPIPWH